MPDVEHALSSSDLGHIRIIAELWGIEVKVSKLSAAIQQLLPLLLNPDNVKEMVDTLPADARSALEEIYRQQSNLPWSVFIRQFGPLREVGAGYRDREKIYLTPVSPAEALWYRGFIARDFFDTPIGPQEFAYIPQDLSALLPFNQTQPELSCGRSATPSEYREYIPADDSILDHACTLLSCLRNGITAEKMQSIDSTWPGKPEIQDTSQPSAISIASLQDLLLTAGLLDASLQPISETTRDFLAAPRNQALALLVHHWRLSQSLNELGSLPGIVIEGDLENNPFQTRDAILKMLSRLPPNTWWNLPAFIEDVKQNNPDFQRPAGDYDSWFIRDAQSGEFLRGFECWDKVDGALLGYFITGWLHWLGIVHLGRSSPTAPVTAIRFTEWAPSLLEGKAPEGLPSENETIIVKSNAEIHIPRLAPRSARYLVARFCEWTGEKKQVYRFRITPSSLENARDQGLTIEQLLSLLKKNARVIPPQLFKALQHWKKEGSLARIESVTILRLRNPDLLKRLRQSRAARFLGDPLSSTTIIIKPGSEQKVIDILAELGYLGEIVGKLF